VGKKRVSHDTENSEISLVLDSGFTNIAHRAPAIIQGTGKGDKIVLTSKKLASVIHHLHVQHFGQEQGEPSTKRRASIAVEYVITVLPTQGVASDIEIIVRPVSRLDSDVRG